MLRGRTHATTQVSHLFYRKVFLTDDGALLHQKLVLKQAILFGRFSLCTYVKAWEFASSTMAAFGNLNI